MSETDDPTRDAGSARAFEEALAFLLVFSDALLDLVPDALVVLDTGLTVRNANDAFAAAFGFADRHAARGAAMAEHPLFRRTVPGTPGRTLAEAMRDLFADGGNTTLDVRRLAGDEEGSTAWSVRASAWDTEDESYRRILVWFRPLAEPPRPDDADGLPPLAAARAGALIRRIPRAAALVDRNGRLLDRNEHFARALGAPDPADRPGEVRLADRFPDLASAGALDLLEHVLAHGEGARRRITLSPPGEEAFPLEIEVQPLRGSDDEHEIQELLLLLHEVHPMSPSTPTPSTTMLPETPDAILEAGRLARFPAPASARVLVVEADSWTRMAVTDALRDAGLSEFAACDSGPAVWARHDPSTFGLVLVGVDTSARDAAEFCRRMTNDLPGVPVVAFTEGPPERAREWVTGLPLAGLVAGSVRSPELAQVAVGLIRRAAPAAAPWAPSDNAAPVAAPDVAPPVVAPEAAAPAESVVPPPIASDADAPSWLPAYEDPFGADSPVAPFDPDPAGGSDSAWAVDPWVSFETASGSAPPPATPVPDSKDADVPAAPVAPPSFFSEPPAIVPFAPPLTAAPAAAAPATPPTPAATPSPNPDARPVLVVGAQVLDLPGLRRLARSSGVRVCMVFDPDPRAPGLVLARELGLPSTSDPAELTRSPTPDAILVGEGGGGEVLLSASLAHVPQILRDEIDLFVADPDSFLEAAASEVVRTPAPEAPFTFPPGAVPPRPEEPAAQPSPEVAAVAPPAPVAPVAPARAEFPAFPAAPAVPEAHTPGGESLLDRDVSALAGAFDLLFDFERLCTNVLDSAIAAVHGATGSLMLTDESGQYLRIVAASGLSDLVVQDTRQRVGQGISGRVAEEGEPLLLVGSIGDERFPVRGERPEIPSAVCVPVIAEGRVLGVMNVNSDPHREPFDQPELRCLADLGRRVGPALDRSWQLRVVRGRSFEMSVRASIESIANASGDLYGRLRQVAARVNELLRVDECAIWMHDPRGAMLALRALAPAPTGGWESLTVPVGSGLPGWVARNRRTLVLRNVPEDPSDLEAGRVTHVLTPIRHHTDLVGVLAIQSATGTVIDDKKLDLLRTIAAVLGEQIRASQAQASSERMVTMLSALAELGVAFSAARDKTSLGRLVAFTASTVLESDVAIVRLLKDPVEPGASGEDLMERVAAHGASPGDDDPLSELEARLVREVVQRGMPVTRADLPARQAESLLTRSNVASVLAVPVAMDKSLLGVVTVFRVADVRGHDVPYGDQDHEIASRLGDYAAGAAHRFLPGTHADEEDES